MPKSRHIKKGQTARQFRKKRNNRRANARGIKAMEKRGMKKAMRIMQEQHESDEDLASLLPENPLEALPENPPKPIII